MISRLKFKSIIALLLCITLTLGAVPQVANAMPGSNIAQEMKEFIFDNVKCKYTEVSSWGSSVNAEIVIENKSDEPIYNWSIDFDYNGTIDNIWNADIKENSDGYYMIKSKDYNAVIRPNSSVSFGLIAHGETEKPSIPENINIYDENGLLFSDDSSEENTTEKDETSSENQSTEDVVSPEPEEDIWISFPERLKALNYTVLTTDNSAFNINANTLKVKGDVHTNSGFGYSGNSIEVVGNLEAVNKIKLNTSSDKDSKKVSALVENAAEVEMPIIL
ncbi:MAG: cellulose binding domain-containing protein [Lachnospiraceae bacterium]|nr:cellulose binding domain-containing protein [Lachnospiraceae bacterium]